MPVPTIGPCMVCTRCGIIGVDAWPNVSMLQCNTPLPRWAKTGLPRCKKERALGPDMKPDCDRVSIQPWRSLMRRREFIAGLASAAVCPIVARAQQGERVRRIGVLKSFAENDPEGKGLHAGTCRVGLDRRPQCADGHSLVRQPR